MLTVAWKHDPGYRKDLLYIFNKLNDLYNKNFTNTEVLSLILKSNITEQKCNDEPNNNKDEDDNDDWKNYNDKNDYEKDDDFDDFCIDERMPFEPLISLQDGIAAHKRKDYNKAWKCFNGHAELGNYLAIYWKAYYLWEGHVGMESDKQTAFKLFKEAADNGIADAQLRFAFALRDMEPKIDSALFLKYLRMAANGGNAAAQYLMGDVYLNGKLGLDKDEKKGIDYLKLAAVKDHEKARIALDELGIPFINSNTSNNQ